MEALRMPRLFPPPPVLSIPLAALTVALACYNPKIEEGAFLCGTDNSCPDGFTCVNMRCWKGSPTDGSAPAGDTAPGCSPATSPTGACDPVCQTGCSGGTNQCTNDGRANLCKAPSVPGELLYASCDPLRDTCRPGLVCLEEFDLARCGAHCYRFCRQDVDCGENSRCVGEVADSANRTLYKTCSPRGGNCNPTGTNPRCADSAPADRRNAAFACYLVSPEHPDETVCECVGTIPEGEACKRTNECVPGNECIPVGQDVRCRRLCTPQGSALQPPVPCTLPQTCQVFQGTRRVGYCAALPRV